MTLLTKLCLILEASSSTNSSLKVIDDIISQAIVQLGAIQPLRMHTILSTFSTRWCGLTILRKSMM